MYDDLIPEVGQAAEVEIISSSVIGLTWAASLCLGAYTNISPGWLSSLLFVGGLASTAIGGGDINFWWLPDAFKPLRFLRKATCAVAMVTPFVAGGNWLFHKNDASNALNGAAHAAIHQVLDGQNTTVGCEAYKDYAVVRKMGTTEEAQQAAKIITREEPTGVGHPGHAEVELEGRNADGSARRFLFDIVQEPDGNVTYYMEVLDQKWVGGMTQHPITLDARKPHAWGVRGEVPAQSCLKLDKPTR